MSDLCISPEWLASVRRAVSEMIDGSELPKSTLVCGLIDRVLTPQQAQVLALLGAGKDNQEIAEVMNLHSKTVSVHKHNLRRTLGLPHATAVVVAAVRYLDAKRTGGAQ